MKRLTPIAIVLSFLISCEEKEPPRTFCEEHPEQCVDIREVKDYFYFDYGSWWVYEEENTGRRDSVYILQTTSDPESVDFSTQVFSTYDNYEYRYWNVGQSGQVRNNQVDKSVRSTIIKKSKAKPGNFVSEAVCFIFSPNVGEEIDANSGTEGYDNILRVENIFPTLMVEGQSFSDVVFISEEHTWAEESQPTEHYYSPGIGLVKKELIDSNQVWNLVDYHIEQ